jgi:hypothetical protein
MRTNQVSTPTRAQLEAARRLWAHANSGTRQSRHSAAFLLSLYNGSKFPVSLSSLTLLDHNLYQDCVRVLEMHYYEDFFIFVGATDEEFEQLAARLGSRGR